ncbi:MAG: flagellar M-ring protein FliF [Pseudomonadota bacterium]|jgi:flagellar M-ring protein FliF
MFERLKTFFDQFRSQSSVFIKGLTTGRKIALTVGVLSVFAILLAVSFYRPAANYEVAYTNLSHEDRTLVLALFKKQNVNDFKIDGETLMFPEEKLNEYKMILAQEGLPSNGVSVGWEKFDDRSFGMTDFDQRISKLRAIQGELSRSINKLDPVESSRVHIVMPDPAIFAQDKKPTTASIMLRLKPGKQLSPKQVQGILHLVARAVEGLEPNNIAIVDELGNMLTKPEEEDGGLDKVTSAQREYQKRVERELETSIREILGRVVGHNKVVAKVQADVDFKKIETTVQDVDPERTVVLGSQKNEQSSQGQGLNPTGVPGAKSNLPGEKDDAAGGGSASSNKQTMETLNFDVKRTVSRIIEPVGSLKKISTAVLVDGKLVDGKYVGRTPEEVAMITKLVKNAIGFQEGRDTITVENAPFEMDEMAVAEQASLTARKTSLIQTGIIASVSILAMIFLYFALLRPYFRWLTFDPDKRSDEQLAIADYELERSGSAAKRVQVQEEVPFEKLSHKEQILYLARHDPKKTTEALRQLLSPQQH